MLSFSARTAIVTGAGKGIGRAVARDLAGAGISLALAARTAADVEAAAAECRAKGVQALGVAADVSRLEDVQRLFAAARGALGPIDVLVNGAGIAPSAPLVRTTDAQWHETLALNLTGCFYAMREALPSMLERRFGRVVNLASIAGKTGSPYISAYAASKHGLLGLTKCAALEVAEQGVTVNAVCPGYVDTPMTDAGVERMAVLTRRDPGEIRGRLAAMSPQKRLMTAEEVARMVLYLVSDEARGVTGQALSLDGGTLV
ncbi:MAG: SDR family NAD(P)-dependent oxidoreductase [Vicinamibacteria bacterium]